MSTYGPLDVTRLFRKHGVPISARTDGLVRVLEAISELTADELAELVVREFAFAIRQCDARRPDAIVRGKVFVPTKWLDLN